MKARISNCSQLVTPRPPKGGEAMEKHDGWTYAGFHHVESGSMCRYVAVDPWSGSTYEIRWWQ